MHAAKTLVGDVMSNPSCPECGQEMIYAYDGFVEWACLNSECPTNMERMKIATEEQAKAAYEQFVMEPHPEGFEEYPDWEKLKDKHRQLWFRVATAAINGRMVE